MLIYSLQCLRLRVSWYKYPQLVQWFSRLIGNGVRSRRTTLSLNQFFLVLGEEVESGVIFLSLFYDFATCHTLHIKCVCVYSLYCCLMSWKSSTTLRIWQPLQVLPLMELHLPLTLPKELLGKLFIHSGEDISTS